MLKIRVKDIGAALILLGLFLFFALIFNGGIGETFVNLAVGLSAALMLVSGFLATINAKLSIVTKLIVLSLLTYFPLIWQRFNYDNEIDIAGLTFDAIIVAILFLMIRYGCCQHQTRMNKKYAPNKQQQPTVKSVT